MSAPDTPVRGAPIAVHAALLVAIALIASYVVMIATIIALPPRPPEVMRGDKVIEAFAAGYARQKAGLAPQAVKGALFRVEGSRPRREQAMRRGRFLAEDLARRIGLPREKVIVAIAPTPGDVLVFRVRREEFHTVRREGPEEREEREGRGPSPPPPPAAVGVPMPPMPPDMPRFAPPPPGVILLARFYIAAELPDGRWIALRQSSTAETRDWLLRAALALGGILLIVFLLVLAFANRLAAPIQRFAESARRVGVDPEEDPVREEGPRELRTAARAVNAMQTRLRALVAERTEMLAAVAHDLRTPLMRMRLVAEGADPSVRDRLVKEAAEIDALVSSFIAFARDDPAREERKRLDLAALVQSVADDRAEAGGSVTYAGPDRLVVMGQALGLKRLFNNLIDNALKYGAAARVALRQEGGSAIIDIADDGPGVAEDARERVFRPFVRGPSAGDVPGAGLGLTAAREIARAHGGDVTILDGSVVRVTLPL